MKMLSLILINHRMKSRVHRGAVGSGYACLMNLGYITTYPRIKSRLRKETWHDAEEDTNWWNVYLRKHDLNMEAEAATLPK